MRLLFFLHIATERKHYQRKDRRCCGTIDFLKFSSCFDDILQSTCKFLKEMLKFSLLINLHGGMSYEYFLSCKKNQIKIYPKSFQMVLVKALGISLTLINECENKKFSLL